MLGGLALLAMLGGSLVAAGALFDWEFLFSDGRHPHGWATSMGRAAARTVLGLAGGVLLAGGFVARVIAVAERPQVAVAPAEDSRNSSIEPAGDLQRPAAETPPADSTPPVEPRESPARSEPAGFAARPAPSEARPAIAAPPPAASPLQAITLWNPAAVIESGGTTLFTVDYRFEAGHRPRATEEYLWVIDAADKTRVVQYEGSVLQQQGHLQHVIQT
ncbi:MAG TPA: hypothetical protein VFW87_05255, partial [Pirellulales bacterium]|nr:hypothetical protein [Pirellulales bacterium]